jgi:tyrosine-specific transport protein
LVFAAIAFSEAAALQDDCAKLEGVPKTVANSGKSVASVIKFAFGKKWALLAGGGFLAQMVAVLTANVVKGAELVSFSTGIPYPVACILPATLIGAFTFGTSRPERVEQVNTAMTIMMVGGFATLIATTFGAGHATGKGNLFGSLIRNNNWARLLPNTQQAWAIPIFVKLLAFGEAMPLLVERMALLSSGNGENGNNKEADAADDEVNDRERRTSGLKKLRKATFLGAGIPLLLAVIWAGISVALVEPTSPNPLISLLEYGPSIAFPVLLLAYGAIGTTLLGAFLAMGHFCQDMICSKFGYCSIPWMKTANVLTVMIPCLLALFGSSLYLPLLAFAGAYPTTLLYGLAPSLAAMTLRKRAQKKLDENLNGETGFTITPHLVPGGKRTLVAMAATALGLVGASTLRAGRFFAKAVA